MKRRELLETALEGTALVLLLGCNTSGDESKGTGTSSKELPAACELPADIPASTLALRASLEYVDRGTQPERLCDRCMQFEPRAGACGGCKLVPGPIHPKGTCKVFVPLPG